MEKGPSSSEACRFCHRDIHAAWRRSLHARSLRNDVFLDAFSQARDFYGDEKADICLRCHAPFADKTGDRTLAQALSWEGVTCDWCHSITEVREVEGNYEALLQWDGIKRGPIRDAEDVGHGVAYSPMHETSITCAPCHEYTNANGIKVLSTYSEWEKSPQAKEGQNCQACHMAEVKAEVVDPKVIRLEGVPVNLHEMPGSHSVEMLNKALHVSMKASREGDELVVTVTLENRGAGHMLPTGSPTRKLELILEVTAGGGARYEERRVFGRTLGDANGEPILEDSRQFLDAVSVLEDTRIPPGESHDEVFRFSVPKNRYARVNLRVVYYHRPFGTEEQETRVVCHTLTRTLPAS
jgi:hypothetical protein